MLRIVEERGGLWTEKVLVVVDVGREVVCCDVPALRIARDACKERGSGQPPPQTHRLVAGHCRDPIDTT